MLLVCDEVATGFGRTGSLFASRRCGIEPDLLVLGKGITGGYLPMSATVASGRVFVAFMGEDLGPSTFYHGHSYGGNALAAAVASAPPRADQRSGTCWPTSRRARQELGRLLAERVAPLTAGDRRAPLRFARRRGAALDVSARAVCSEAVRNGVLLRSLGQVVPLVPPLTITSEELERIVSVLERAIATVSGNGG